MKRTHSQMQMQHTDKFSQHSSVIWPVWLNDSLFVYKLVVVGSIPVAAT